MFKTRPGQLARIGFGAVLTLGVLQMAVTAITTRGSYRTAFALVDLGDGTEHAAGLLIQVWLLAAVAAGIGYLIGRRYQGGSVDRFHAASFVVPAIGIAFALPLTLHLGVFAAVNRDLHGFDEWFTMSLMFAGVPHVLFAVLLAFRVHHLARGETAMSVGMMFFFVVLSANLPIPLVPAAVVALTGVPMLPLLYGMDRYIARQRDLLAQDTTGIPAAIVVA